MRVAVLGGGGFIGSHLSEALLAHGDAVTVFDRQGAPFLGAVVQAGAEPSLGDFLDAQALRAALSGCDVVYHLISATVPSTSNEDPIHDAQANIIGTLQLLEEAKRAGVSKIIFASSGGTVYGIPEEIPIREDHATQPTSAYGISKLAIEKYLHLYWVLHKLDYRVLRVANVYGERGPMAGSQGVIGSFLESIHRQQALRIWGDGSVIRDYIHVSDVVNAMIDVAAYEGRLKVFNIGGGRGYSLNDIIGLMEVATQQPIECTRLPGRAFDVPANVLDISQAREHLNWQPRVGVLEGIERTYEWMLAQRGN